MEVDEDRIRSINSSKLLTLADILSRFVSATELTQIFDRNLLCSVAQFCMFCPEPEVHDVDFCIQQRDMLGIQYYRELSQKSRRYILDKICNNDQLECIRNLIELDNDCFYRDSFIRDALQYACENGYLEIVKFLIRVLGVLNGTNIQEVMGQGICLAASCGQLAVVKYLSDHGADIRRHNDYPLRCAAINGYLEVVRFLFERGAGVRSDALQYAVQNGHMHVVKFLVEQDRSHNLDLDLSAALCKAVANGRTNIVQFLTRHGVDIR